MNFVLALELDLHLETSPAEALAGALLLLVEDLVRERSGPELAAQLRQAVPELHEWQTSAPTLAIPVDLATLEATPRSVGDLGEVEAVLSRFGVGPEAAPAAASITLRFIATRLPPETARAIVDVVPVLIGQTGA